MAAAWKPALRAHQRKSSWEASSPVMINKGNATHVEALVESRFKPSGGRSVEKAADLLASGIQPTRKALPQLVPDGMPPDLHLKAALRVKHPLAYEPATTAPVRYALDYAPDDLDEINNSRGRVAKLLRKLADACSRENEELLEACAPSVQAVLKSFGRKNVALMREIAYTCNSRDVASPAFMLIGLPMLGWAPGADGLMVRVKEPEVSINDFLAEREERNRKLFEAMKPSSDPELDKAAFTKTMAEVDRGVLEGPFLSMAELPWADVALVPRHGIWEMHGGATESTCRCIDDMLMGEQNSTVGTVSSHRPTDPDGLAAQVRAVRRRFPSNRLQGWPCDLEKAYKQVPAAPHQLKWTVIVMWSTLHGHPVFFCTRCQLFGGKSPPLNFARYAAWLCEAASALFLLATSHCVDDVISVEPEEIAASGNISFKLLCHLTGWAVSPSKAPAPENYFLVIGVVLDLTQVPDGEAVLKIAPKRIEQLTALLNRIEAIGRLGSGEAASLTGKLGFTLCASFGRFGRAKLRPYIRRCNESRVALNPQIRSANRFWLQFLASYTPRPIPAWLDGMEMVVSYSDGEGAEAGLGIAVWSSKCPKAPLAAYCKIPDAIRDLWSKQVTAERNDIYCIEAVGPLAIAVTFPNIVKNALWMHWIDNSAAQYALVRGSSSILSGDVIVGETWRRVQKLNAFLYVDRVESEANPVDGLSRGRRDGPWTRISQALLPKNLVNLLAAERGSESCPSMTIEP